ncbi:hypothetical protein [Cobetia sp. QF-1]|uniref:hypothetical protein n=1 Tax=Cobetia sp. QF-1 TaxID=1969833 RepID=UPI00113265DF|nr:hypothetical protein [Cobetia sp. QF-1]
MHDNILDIIWNISLICPWDCEFCCTDAVHVKSMNGEIIAKEHSLRSVHSVDKQLIEIFQSKYPDINPTKYDLALLDRQLLGKEPTYEEKVSILQHLKGYEVKIDFAGGDPLACYENFLIIKKASEIFGKESISITSTGVFIKRYGIEEVASIIGEYEFTYDQAPLGTQGFRPAGYNFSNLKLASEFATLGIRTKAQLPLHSQNFSKDNAQAIYSELCKHNIDEVLIMRLFPVGRGQGNLMNSYISKDKLILGIQNYKALSREEGTKVRLQCALRHLLDVSDSNPCDLMQGSYGINFSGKLLISAWANNSMGRPLSEDFVLGDLKKEYFKHISETEKFKRYTERLDENFGHCKVFAYLASKNKNEDAIFSNLDPIYV